MTKRSIKISLECIAKHGFLLLTNPNKDRGTENILWQTALIHYYIRSISDIGTESRFSVALNRKTAKQVKESGLETQLTIRYLIRKLSQLVGLETRLKGLDKTP